MSWLLNLFKTYEANIDRVGEIEKKHNGQEYTLLPVSHTTQNAHIEVNITEDGEYHSATIIDKSDASTVIPCTEESTSRSGTKIAPYPLHDKLSYVAGDLVTYSTKTKSDEPFLCYIKNLEDWVKSPYVTPQIKSIHKYVSKKCLIRDLVANGILVLDEEGYLIDTWHKKYESLFKEKPHIFSVVSGAQESAFVRFTVRSTNDLLPKVWKDKKIYESFIHYYNHLPSDQDLCYITGEMLPSTERHANKIRHAADKAKLISANDTSGFTYRGRFHDSQEVASISYEVSQKAHNALKWLINRQGKTIDQRVFLVWGNDEVNIPDPTGDSLDLHSLYGETTTSKEKKSFTNEEFAKELAKAIDGYRNNLNTNSEVNILVLDSATTGRMAVLYYRNLNKELYLDRLKKWHTTGSWLHRYRKKESKEFVQFYGAPATKDIAFAAYGPNASDKVVKGCMERMLPCIIDEKKIPKDIVYSAFYRASNPVSMDRWEWEKTLSITCSLINKREEYEVALDPDNTNRDYLFGRLLAVADVLERNALGSEETRSTNAIRYMNSFSKYPERTWKTIQASLQSYQMKLGSKGIYYSQLIDKIASKIKFDDFNNKPLSGKYLLGFYSQRHELYQKKDSKKESTNEGEMKNGNIRS